MADKKQTQQERPSLIIAGKPATQQEMKRILNTKASASDPDDRATKRISQVDRGFKLLR